MGVPILREILTRCQRPSNAELFPYFYDRTTRDKYNSALAVESTGCCVTKFEYAKLSGIEKNGKFLDLTLSKNSFIIGRNCDLLPIEYDLF